MPMHIVTVVYALALILLGVITFLRHQSPTALIPAYAGVLFLAFGLISMAKATLRKHVMHAAAALGLLLALAGLGMAASSMLKAGFDTAQLARPAATLSQAIMGTLSAGFVAACVLSFIAARKARVAAGEK